MTDTEKKIAEIREALEKATPGPWVYDDICDDICVDKTDVIVCNAVGPEDGLLIANAPEWLRFLLSELDKRDEENRKLREDIERMKKQDIDVIISYAVERQKLIEGLRLYANPRNWYGDVFAPPEGISDEVDDGGQRARDILKEIGVTVDV